MRNLLGRLHERSPASLAGIARFWQVELRGRDVHADVGLLFRVMTDPWAFAMAFDRLGQAHCDLLQRLIERDETASGQEIARRLEQPFDAIRADLAALYRAGFLYAEHAEFGVDEGGEARLLVPREVVALTRRLHSERQQPDPDDCSLDELLERLDDFELNEIAREHGYTVIPTVALRADILAYLRPRLADPERLPRLRARLAWPESDLFEWLESSGRAYPEPARTSLGMTADELRDAIRGLVHQGLVWRGYDARGKLEIVVPRAIREPEPLPAAPAPELQPVPGDQVDDPAWIYPWALAWDLQTVLREVQIGRTRAHARMLQDGGDQLSATAARRLANRLWNADEETIPTGYLWFIDALARGEDLLDDRDPPGLTDQMRPWTRLSFPEQTRRMGRAWLNWSHFYEARGRDSIEVWGARWPEFRARLARHLLELDPDTWYTVASFSEQFAHRESDALGTQFSAALNREQVDESLDARRQDVVRFAAELTLLTACEWLGMVQITRSRRRGYALRLTTAGRWLLETLLAHDIEAVPEPPDEEPTFGEHPIAVQPTFEVLLLRPEPRLVWALSGLADLDAIDRVSTYRLTESSIHRALDAGATVDAVLRALEHYGSEVPENVAYQVREWEATYKRARLSLGFMIELSHATELAALEERLTEQGFAVDRLDQTRLMVLVGSADRLEPARRAVEEILRELGVRVR